MTGFDNETRTRVFADVTVTMDPTAATCELEVDGTWYPATWVADAIHRPAMGDLPERWLRRARTAAYFAGPGVADPAGAEVLTEGRHETQVRITLGGDIIVGHASVIDVED